MLLHTLISTFQTVLHQHTGMGYFVDLLLKSFFVLLLMLAINLFTRNVAASVRHLIWCIGIIALFFLPLFIGFIPKIPVPITATEVVVTQSTVTREIASMADNLDLALDHWWRFFVGVYLSILAMQLLYTLLGLCKVFFLSRSSRPVENPVIVNELENRILEEGLTVSVRLRKSSEIFSPVSWGLFRPEIILPEAAENWDHEKTRNVLIHELSHIQRLDWLTCLIMRITRAVYWYNPLIWYAAGRLHEEAEQACDDAVILDGHCRNEYASNLLEIASHARLATMENMVVQAIAGSYLGSRVFSILDTSRKRQKTEFVWVVRAILMTGTVIAILASLRLVPLVNVSTIAPDAVTTFPVMFIPNKDKSLFTHDDREVRLVDEDIWSLPGGRFLGRKRETPSQPEGGSPRQEDTNGIALSQNETGMQSNDAGENSTAADPEQGRKSLLDEYMSFTGMKNSREIFESSVNEYTNSILKQVESGVRMRELAMFEDDEQTAEEKTPIVAIRRKEPVYPFLARKRGIEGYSIVEYEIDTGGNVINPVIVDSSPGSIFNRSSLEAIQQYSFKPPEQNGRVVSLKGLQTKFVYQLKPG